MTVVKQSYDAIRAIVADDETHVRLYVVHTLQRFGLESITQAANGEEVIKELASSDGADLLLMDVSMPRMNGIETLRQVKQLYPDLTVVMLTSSATRAVVVQAFECGADYFLRKDEVGRSYEVQLKKIIEKMVSDTEA